MRRDFSGPPRQEAKGRNNNQLLIYSHPIAARRAFYPLRHYYLNQVITASQGFQMEIITANAHRALRSALAVVAMRFAHVIDTTAR